MFQETNDVCKEVLTIIGYCDNKIIEKIPTKVLKSLSDMAADSKQDYYIDTEKDLYDQNISEDSKNLISLIYYNYIADNDERNELLKLWNDNESTYQENLRKKYNPDDIFKKKDKQESSNIEILENNNTTSLIEYKESFFTKLKNFVFKILHINN